jgi:integrase
MARQAKEYTTTTKTARAKLGARPKPYYRQIGPGKTLGYLRRDSGPGAWVVRERIAGRYTFRTLGTADDLAAADGRDVLTFEQAMRIATGANAAAAVGRLTVGGALDVYLTALASRSKYADDERGRVEKHVPPALLNCRVDRLTKTILESWQASMVRDDPADPDAKRRSQDSANRLWTTVRAALNLAYSDEANGIASDRAWSRVKPFKNVSRSSGDDLDAKQVRLLIAKAASFDTALAHLCEAGFLTGARFGELASASVRDLDAARHTLHVDGKTGERVVNLTAESADFLRSLATARDRDAPLLPRADGSRWPRSWHHKAVKRAAAMADLPASVSFYTLRHAHISRALEAGMPLSLVAENCGTSLRMLEVNYARVLASTRRDTIERTAPKLRRAN